MTLRILTVLVLLCTFQLLVAQPTKRTLRPGDIYRLQTISDANISPDGLWVAFTLSNIDSAKDKRNTDVWMASTDGKEIIQLTSSPDNESSPRWSPDGKYISFLSARQGGSAQVWLLDRRGGEGIKLTDAKSGVSFYSWSPDNKMLVLGLKDEKDTTKNKTPQPIVINRFRFKQDVSGYLNDTGRTHLYLFDIASKKTRQLTKGIYNEAGATWSPDGKTIAFVSNQTPDPDTNENTDIWVVDTAKGSVARRLTTWTGGDADPQWSPDGKKIAYVRSMSDAIFEMYDQTGLYVIDVAGGNPIAVSAGVDRPVSAPRWLPDGKGIVALVADDRQRYVSLFNPQGGMVKTLFGGDRSYSSVEVLPSGKLVGLMSESQLPSELYVLENDKPRRITTIQGKFVDSLNFASVEKFNSTSKDGAVVGNMVYYPAGGARQKLPTIFYIHGGPTSQDELGFDLTRQMLAAHGYAVVAVNYRGSLGKGLQFSRAISGDWGNKEVLDILGAADYLVEKGIADPAKLGIAGWSYGGILTDYVIASDTRFKAASSGAGVAAPLSLFGVDQYINQYVNEIGYPWQGNNIEKYLKLSYPFLHADKIKTPTQFMVGEKDFNVPAAGSEQMYQALRVLNVPTELLVYPNQFHGFTQPSFIKDRYERYFAWFDKYLK